MTDEVSGAGTPPVGRPGWWPDPQLPDTRRWWDGAAWTEHVAPANGPFPTIRRDGEAVPADTLDWVGWFVGFVLPIAGIIWGIVEIGRSPRLGAQLIAISILASIVWAVIILR